MRLKISKNSDGTVNTAEPQIDALTEFLNQHGFRANEWKGIRIYLNGYGRDIKAFIELDNPDIDADHGNLFSGCALKVYTNCQQPRSWRLNRAKQVKHTIMADMSEANLDGDGNLYGGIELGDVCDEWEDVIL